MSRQAQGSKFGLALILLALVAMWAGMIATIFGVL